MLVLVPLLLSCSPPQGERAAWLQEQILRENASWLAENPDGLAGKFTVMTADLYDFMRGCPGTWYADLARPGKERLETEFLDSSAAAQVLLVGDPHPENFGLGLPGEGPGPAVEELYEPPTLTAEFQDLDSSTYGPWLLDLRRTALGLAALGAGLPGCEAACQAAMSEAVAAGYAAGALGGPVPGGPGRILGALEAAALRAGPSRERLMKYTVEAEIGREIRLDDALDQSGRGLLALTAAEQAQLDRLLAAYPAPEGFTVRDAARLFGVGVSSRPALRYLVLWDRGGVETADLLSIREVIDPPVIPGLVAEPGERFSSNAQRVATASRLLWTTPDADARSAGLEDWAQSFKVQTWSSWFEGLNHEDIADGWAEGDYDEADLADLAAAIGRALALAHRRAPTASGGDARRVLAVEIAGREAALAAEISAFAEADLAQLRQDSALFAALLETEGPLLGAERLLQGMP